MAQLNEKVVPVDIEEEMKGSYIDYSMSVITARALPDVRDGLKPSNRRILVAMNDLGLAPGRGFRKCAKIAGDTSGNYHPHGEQIVYPSLVRMAQDFNMRYMLVEGQGNFGSIDGDDAAAMRYTEARLTPLAMEMLSDLQKDTVKFVPNYDGTREEPRVLPAKFPNLLCNGSSGIAVGMATNIPPHNLSEVIDGCIAYIGDSNITNEKLMKHITAPDFPTGGIIYGYEGVKDAYTKGRGRILVRAKANIQTVKGERQRIIVSQIPYQVNKAGLIATIAELVNDKKLEDISDIRDESDRDGMRIVIELKRDGNAEVVLNNLYKHTQMQTTFGVIMLSLVDGRPQVLTLREMIKLFIEHRNEVIVRRTKFDLDEAEKRAHILEGYLIALKDIDAVIKLIKTSKDVEEARVGLMKKFKLSEIQARAILDMRLQRLTGLERKKVEDEYRETIKLIEKFRGILKNKAMQLKMIQDELLDLKKKYGDPRRTEIVYKAEEFSVEDMIAEEEVVITISHGGFVKRFPVSGYRRQTRGGKGVTGAGMKEDDFMEHMFVASTHDYILIFTDKGRCYWLKVHEIPEAGRMAKGKSINNLITKAPEEIISAFIAVKEFDDKHCVLMVTQLGMIKKVVLSEFSNPRKSGIVAMGLKKNDILKDVKLTDGTCDIVIGTHEGMAIRFHEKEARAMGRGASGVRGIRLAKKDKVIGLVTLKRKGTTILVATDKGYGKRSDTEDYRVSHRGGKGIITVKTSDKNGLMVAIKEVVDSDDVVVVTTGGMIIRQHATDIRVAGRNTQGVKLIRLEEGDSVADVAAVVAEEEEEKKLDAETEKTEKTEKDEEVREAGAKSEKAGKKSEKTEKDEEDREKPEKAGAKSEKSVKPGKSVKPVKTGKQGKNRKGKR